MKESCICGSKKPSNECCNVYLGGEQIPKTPEQLMRSRYTAYALGGFGEYLLETWFPATAQGLNVAELSNVKVDWEKLEVLNKSQRGDEGTVEFKAYFRNKSNEGGEQGLEVMREISEFRRISGRWYYVGGRVS